MNYDILKLDNQLCFSLYAASREITKLYKPFLDKIGLTYTQYISLLVLWESDNITVKELGTRLRLDSGTLTPLLKKLESMDILERLRDKKDERNVYIKLTDKGHNLKDKALDIPSKVFCSSGLSKDESLYLRVHLQKLLDVLDKTNEQYKK
ncbi:transcriptional regulator, MarR family [Clostridium amylolyticum]|uniref:Transcriptional regulator, MarR family n=1 Tax=Clostridium amylolyticum TaxID=1121298 RepID=A0A1M6NR97_9CLOT|nr:MarR family transcriptional regulator [Clostridium amylolyticum]SHJ98225.1 transcriptional regulator, MarR family [Clostridium amylolyticum]